MFKVGDKVVCINIYSIDNITYKIPLILHNTYVISEIFSQYGVVVIVNDRRCAVSIDRFKLLSDFRKQKIEKICSKLVKK
jgi:hypothetical protein